MQAETDLVFFRNTSLSGAVPSGYRSSTNEPAVSNNGDVVFYTGNWYAVLSTDGGASFSRIEALLGIEIVFKDDDNNVVHDLPGDVTIEVSYQGLSLADAKFNRLVIYNATRGLYLPTTIDTNRKVAIARTRQFSTFLLALMKSTDATPTATATASRTPTVSATRTPTATATRTATPQGLRRVYLPVAMRDYAGLGVTPTAPTPTRTPAPAVPTATRTAAPAVTPTPTPGGTLTPAQWIDLWDGYARIWAQDSQQTYLGLISSNCYASESVVNSYGTYGSPYSSTSINNEYGTFGSPYSTYSAFNTLASSPPIAYVPVSGSYSPDVYVTRNSLKTPRIDAGFLIAYLKAKGNCQ